MRLRAGIGGVAAVCLSGCGGMQSTLAPAGQEAGRVIRKAFERSRDQTTKVAPDSAIGRLTRVDALQAGYVSDELRRQMTGELARIEGALRSIEAGTYGICRRCEEPLSEARPEPPPRRGVLRSVCRAGGAAEIASSLTQ